MLLLRVRRFSSYESHSPTGEAGARLRYPVVRRTIPKLERHSQLAVNDYSKRMTVYTVPTLANNYAYVLADRKSGAAALVDPVEPEIVLEVVKREGFTVQCLLSTSHLPDNAGGNLAILAALPDVAVYSFDDRTPGINRPPLADNQVIRLGAVTVTALHTPGFTAGAACYHATVPRDRNVHLAPGSHAHSVLFTGNTLYYGGAGRVFEGTTAEQYRSLVEIIGALPGYTELYYGHEYAMRNLEFADQLAGNRDPDIEKALAAVKEKRAAYLPCVPGFLEDEYVCNPWMRVNHMAVMKMVGAGLAHEPGEILRRIREKRDHFAANDDSSFA